jgi:hypothetical protein
MSVLTVAKLQQSLFALLQGFMHGKSIRVILEEGLQKKTSAVKSGDRRGMENPPFQFTSVVSALRGRESN